MRLEIERSGGFSGFRKTITIETEDLPSEMATNIEKYMANRKSSKLLSTPMKKKKVADSYFYKISGHFGKEKQELNFNEFDVDNELKSFIDYVFKNY